MGNFTVFPQFFQTWVKTFQHDHESCWHEHPAPWRFCWLHQGTFECDREPVAAIYGPSLVFQSLQRSPLWTSSTQKQMMRRQKRAGHDQCSQPIRRGSHAICGRNYRQLRPSPQLLSYLAHFGPSFGQHQVDPSCLVAPPSFFFRFASITQWILFWRPGQGSSGGCPVV